MRSASEHLRMDNGPEMIAWGLRWRDPSRQSGGQQDVLLGDRRTRMEPAPPVLNPTLSTDAVAHFVP